jgi:hypothetical protein
MRIGDAFCGIGDSGDGQPGIAIRNLLKDMCNEYGEMPARQTAFGCVVITIAPQCHAILPANRGQTGPAAAPVPCAQRRLD